MATPKKQSKKAKDPRDMVAADILHFEGLLQHAGWIRLAQIMDKNAELLKEQIVMKRSLEGEPLTDAQVDRLRDRLLDLIEVRNMPERAIKLLTEKGEEAQIDEFDPYEKSRFNTG